MPMVTLLLLLRHMLMMLRCAIITPLHTLLPLIAICRYADAVTLFHRLFSLLTAIRH